VSALVQPDQREGYDDPAVGEILALAAARISAAEVRYASTQSAIARAISSVGHVSEMTF
jgi:hypothetical protein